MNLVMPEKAAQPRRGAGVRLTIARLEPAHLDALMALQHAVVASTPPGLLMPRSEQEALPMLRGEAGCCYGAWEGAQLVAAAMARIPCPAMPNEGPAFPTLAEHEWAYAAAFLSNAMVLPQARGRGLQRKLIAHRLTHARSLGMRWACAGISFHNQTSWRNLMTMGLRVVGLREFAGHTRVGFACHLGTAPPVAGREGVAVRLGDLPAHAGALEAGLVGVGFARGRVVYKRVLDAAH